MYSSNKFSLRETLIILIPGIFISYYSARLLDTFGKIPEQSSTGETSVLFFLTSIISGILIYSFDCPKRLPFFKKFLPTHLLMKDFPDLNPHQLKQKYFQFYDKFFTEEFKAKTNIYTALYHMCLNILISGIVFLAINLLILIFTQNSTQLQFSIDSLLFAIVMLIISIQQIFENKIKGMFLRAFQAFRGSEEYNILIP